MENEKQFRQRVLASFYTRSNRNSSIPVDDFRVAQDLLLESDSSRLGGAIIYLRGKGLLEKFSFGTHMITIDGIDEIENNFPVLVRNSETEHKSAIANNLEIKTPLAHKEYWTLVWKSLIPIVFKNKTIIIIILLMIFASLGFINYSPEINTLVGTFRFPINGTKLSASIATTTDLHQLDQSIFNITNQVNNPDFTSEDRVALIDNISGLETKREKGTIVDKGIGGLILLISGNDAEGNYGILRCDFTSDWKQRLFLLKKNAVITFTGTITSYELDRGWIRLSKCQILD